MSRRLSKPTLCSTLAIAAALTAAPRPAVAQSFIGTVTSEVGAHVHTLGNGQTKINVQNTQAVIDWTATGTPTNGVITFQQAGTIADFEGSNQFAVLNRVTPGVLGNAILLDGTITTSVNGNAGGGTIFFSSPNGIIVGQHAVFDTGSIGFTAVPIASDGNGNWISGFGTSSQTIRFGPAIDPNAFIRVNPGATVASRGSGNYVALLAPKIDLQGTIKTDGVAALVAAEKATLTIRDSGLWDILVDTGTTDPNGITMSGSITRNSAGLTGNHVAYLVSVAKNDAVTMLFNGGSQLGFDVAGAASSEGNSVVLSAGANVLLGNVVAYPSGAGTSSLTLDGLSTNSRLTALAHGTINVTSNSGASTFGGDVTLSASRQVNIAATSNDIRFQKALSVSTDRIGASGAAGTAGDISILANAGRKLSFGGLTTLSANGIGGAAASGSGGNGSGGAIQIQASGGQVSFNRLNVTADGIGGGGQSRGGDGTAGRVTIDAGPGGLVTAIAPILLQTAGTGGGGLAGGTGTGGTVRLSSSGGTVQLGAVNLVAAATGGAGTSGPGGNATGGAVSAVADGGGLVQLSSAVLDASATGGAGGSGLAGQAGGAGGAATGGSALLFTRNTTSGSNRVNIGSAVLSANATGGAGGTGGSGAQGGTGGAGGAATGGTVQALSSAGNGALSVGSLTLAAAGSGGRGGAGGAGTVKGGTGGEGGDGRGGSTSVGTTSGDPGFITAGTATVGSVASSANSTGGAGGAGGSFGGAGGNGGDALASSQSIVARGGTLTIGAASLSAQSTGGTAGSGTPGGIGGNAETSNLLLSFADRPLDGSASHVSIASYDGRSSASASGGGARIAEGTAALYVDGSDVRFGSYRSAVTAPGGLSVGPADTIRLMDSMVTVDGAMVVTTDNRQSVALDNSTLSAGSVTFNTANFVHDVAPYSPAPSQGTIRAGAIAITSGQDIVLDASLVSGGNLMLTASGLVDLGDLIAATDVDVSAGSTVDLRDVWAGGDIALDAGGSIGARNVTGNDLAIRSIGGDVGLGAIASLGSVAIDAVGGDVAFASLSSVFGTQVTAGGDVTGGGMAAGSLALLVDGSISVGSLSAGGIVDLVAGGSILTGSIAGGSLHGEAGAGFQSAGIVTNGAAAIDADGSITLDGDVDAGGSLAIVAGGAITARNLKSGGDMGLSSGGNASLANARAGGDLSFAMGGGLTAVDLIAGGDIALTAQSASLRDLSGGGGIGWTIGSDLTLRDATAAGSIAGLNGGLLTAQNLTAGLDVNLQAGTIATNDLAAGRALHLAAGSAAVHDIRSGASMNLETIGGLTLDDAVAGGDIDANAGSIRANDLTSGGSTRLHAASLSLHDIVAGGGILIDSGSLEANDLNANGDIRLFADSATFRFANAGGSIAGVIDRLLAATDMMAGVDLDLQAGSIAARNLTAGNDLRLRAQSVGVNNVTAGRDIDLNGGTVAANDLVAGRALHLAAGNATVHDLRSGGSIAAMIDGSFAATDLTAGADLNIQAGSLSARDLTAGGLIRASTTGAMTIGSATANGDLSLDSGGAMATGALSAGGSVFASGDGTVTTGDVVAGLDIGAAAGTTLAVGDLDAGRNILLAAPAAIVAGSIHAGGDFLSLGGGAMQLGSIDTGGQSLLGGFAMLSTGGLFGPTFDFAAVLAQPAVASGGTIAVAGNIAAGSLVANAGDDFTSGDIDSRGPLQVEATHDIDVGSVTTLDALAFTAGDLVRNSAGSILTGDVTATGAILFSANGTIGGGDLMAGGNLTLIAPGAIATNDLDAINGNVAVNSGTSIATGNIGAAGGIALSTPGTITAESLEAGAYVIALAGGDLRLGAIDAGGPAYLANRSMMSLGGVIGGDFDAGPVLASTPAATGGSIVMTGPVQAASLTAAAGTSLTAGDITTSSAQDIRAATSIAAGALQAGTDVSIDTAGTVAAGNVSAGGRVNVWGAGGATLGDVAGSAVSIASDHQLSLGAIAAVDDVLLAAGGTLSAGAIAAGGDLIALAGGNLTLGTVDVGGRFGLAGYGLLALAGGRNDFRPEVVFAALSSGTAAPTGGAVTLAGPVQATLVDARVGQSLTTAAIAADTIRATVGTTAGINGVWSAGPVDLASNDIAIGANGGIHANHVLLRSTNAAQTLIGDGLVPAGQSVAGYLLDGAEFGRIDAGTLVIVGRGDASARVDMLIGDLALKSGEGDTWRSYAFATGSFASPGASSGQQAAAADLSGFTPSGIIRVVGDVVGAPDALLFAAGTIEVDANTATIALEQGGELTGALTFQAPHIHVASSGILDKLETDLNYQYRDYDLQTPAATARPDGVVRAGSIFFDLINSGGGAPSYSILAQNTGTPAIRAGTLTQLAQVVAPDGTAPGTVDLVINLQIDTGEEILTGDKVRDAFMAVNDAALFTPNSSIGGCPVAGGACLGVAPPPPTRPTPGYDPNPPLQSQLVLISTPAPDKSSFGNEEAIEDNQEDGGVDSATSPIVPPQPLFDTRPLDSGDETDEPISGGGNPALIGSGSLTLDQLDDEDEKKKKKKAGAVRAQPADPAEVK